MDRSRSAPRSSPKEGGGDRARPFSLRLSGLERVIDTAPGTPVALRVQPDEPAAGIPAGRASGAADPENPLRIDSFAAIAASLDGDARRVFEEAVQLLDGLRIGRDHVEAKLRETGRADPIRTVTGTSALDAAIERTQEIIRLLGEMRSLDDEAQRL